MKRFATMGSSCIVLSLAEAEECRAAVTDHEGDGQCDNDTLVILGDVGVNYYLNKRDIYVKEQLNTCGPIVLCIHGNHECRPAHVSGYGLQDWNNGQVYVQPEYPHVLFAVDGEVYTLEGRDHLVIGGAYSVDKYYRLMRGFRWWEDEQPDEATKAKVEQVLAARDWQVPVVLSHTCPFKYEPVEAFLPGIDQSSVDASTERWLDMRMLCGRRYAFIKRRNLPFCSLAMWQSKSVYRAVCWVYHRLYLSEALGWWICCPNRRLWRFCEVCGPEALFLWPARRCSYSCVQASE